MSNCVVKISDASVLAFHTMLYLSSYQDRLVSTKEIANKYHVSENHLAKVLQRLVKVGLVDSIRGPKGGFKLGRDAGEISLIEIYEIMDGPIGMYDCLLDESSCGGGNSCLIFNGLLGSINHQFKDYLSNKKLSDLQTLYEKQD